MRPIQPIAAAPWIRGGRRKRGLKDERKGIRT